MISPGNICTSMGTFLLVRVRDENFKIYSGQLSNMQRSMNYSHHAVHDILMTCSFCGWKFIPFESLSPISTHGAPNHRSVLCMDKLGMDKPFSVWISLVCFRFHI